MLHQLKQKMDEKNCVLKHEDAVFYYLAITCEWVYLAKRSLFDSSLISFLIRSSEL